MKGIDVSSHQGLIDWDRVKKEVDFAIIRLGYGDNIESQDDVEFFNNVNGCISNNIPFGVYLYSYAKKISGSESIDSEIEHTKRLLSQISVKPFCVYIDMEDNSTIYLGKGALTDFAIRYCREISNSGYKAGVYANSNWFNNYLDVRAIANNNYSIWCAKYSNDRPSIGVNYDIWQYTSTYQLDGIDGYVDMNLMVNDIVDIRENNNITKVNVFYRVKTIKNNWLPEVKNLDDYAGYQNNPITGLAIKVDKGSVKYRVHLKNKGWLNYVTGYNINDIKNGYAGNGRDIIDLIEVYYYTPANIRPYKKIKYRVNNYSWQYDNEKSNGQDGYAGKLGVDAVKVMIVVE